MRVARLGAGAYVRVEDRLDSVEHIERHERLVTSGVPAVAVLDEAGIVAGAQHALEVGPGQRLEPTGSGVVDVLEDRDELSARGVERLLEIDKVADAPCEAVDLEDDDVADVSLLTQPPYEPPQLGTTHCLSRLATVDVVVNDLRPDGFRLAYAVLALARQRQPLRVEILLDLAARADTQVGHGRLHHATSSSPKRS